MMRIPVIAGNWKMNLSIAQATELVRQIHHNLSWPGEVEVIVAPTFVALSKVADELQKSYISLAAQDLFWKESGAFTGEVSAAMLKDAGADYVIIGHSERRQYFGETDQTVNQKVRAALGASLIPIVCVGETLEQREGGNFQEVIASQLMGGLVDIVSEKIIIAYEPVWAIGTGKVASPEQVEQMHSFIRSKLSTMLGEVKAQEIRILYGGSVNAKNSQELLALNNVDGALVGGASLKAADFMEIIKSGVCSQKVY